MKKRGTYRFVIVFVMLTCSLMSCLTAESNRKPGKLFIVVTTGMIKDAVVNIAGEKAHVVALMGPGVDPHLYKASHGDLEKITDADIIFYNGLHLEGKMGTLFEKAERLKPVVPVSKGIPESVLRPIAGYENAHDPHIWFDVRLWSRAVKNIGEYLASKDSSNAAYYEANTAKYLAKLDSLDRSVRTELSKIPQQQRVLITAHDAFGYFGDAYKVEVRGLQGISTLSEFGLKDVTDLVNFIIARKIKAIFVESSVSTKSIDAIVQGCREKGWNVTIGGSLYSDAMGAENTHEATYIGMVDANVRTIVNALK